MLGEMLASLEASPIIAAVKNPNELKKALVSSSNVVFVLFGDICSIAEHVQKIKKAGKIAIIHIDLVEGLEKKTIALDFVKNHTNADGVISTKPNLLKKAKELGLITVQRFFLIDSIALKNIKKHMELEVADFVEILPGVMPKIIKNLVSEVKLPLIAGGLISDKEDVINALSAGAIAVSCTLESVWDS